MSFLQYYHERKDADGENLFWPGGPAGYPFRGQQAPNVTKAEYDKSQLAGKARCRLFHLSQEEELKAYVEVRDKCANGLYVLLDRDRVWDPDSKHYRIFLEWIELSYTVAKDKPQDAIHELKPDDSLLITHGRLAGLKANQDGW